MKFALKFALAALLIGAPLHAKVKNPRETVAGFLKWYAANYDKAYSFELISTKGRYTVNLEGCRQYLAFLKSSSYLSDAFLDRMMGDFKGYDAIYKKEFVDDGPPEGFDYDLILQTQDIDDTLERIKNLEPGNIEKNGDTWIFDYLEFTLSPETGLIEAID